MAEDILRSNEIPPLDILPSIKFVNNLDMPPPVDLSIPNNHIMQIGDIEHPASNFPEKDICTGTDELYSHWLLGIDSNHDHNTDNLDPINYSNSLKPSSSFMDSCLDFRLDNFSPDELWSRTDLDRPPNDESFSSMMNIDYTRNFSGPIGYSIPAAHTKIPDNFYNHIAPAHEHQRGMSADFSSLFIDSFNPNLHNPYNAFMPFKNTQFPEFNTPDIFMEDERNEALLASNNLSSYNKEETTYHTLQPKSMHNRSEEFSDLFDDNYLYSSHDLNEQLQMGTDEYLKGMSNDEAASLNLNRIITNSDRAQVSINNRLNEKNSQQIDNFALNMNIVKEILAGRGRNIASLPVRRPVGRPPNRQRESRILANLTPEKQSHAHAIIESKPVQNIVQSGRFNNPGFSSRGMSHDMSLRSREISMEAYMRKITESVARNNALMNIEPIVIDTTNKPGSMPEAICRYIDYLVEENEKRTRISSCINSKAKTEFLKEEYYRQVFCNPVPFPTKKFQDWLKLFNVYVEITDLDGQTLPQTIFQTTSMDATDIAELIGDPLNLEHIKSPKRDIEHNPNWSAMRTFPASLRTRGRPKGSYSNSVNFSRSMHKHQSIQHDITQSDESNTPEKLETKIEIAGKIDDISISEKEFPVKSLEEEKILLKEENSPKKCSNLREVKLFMPRSSVAKGGIRIFRTVPNSVDSKTSVKMEIETNNVQFTIVNDQADVKEDLDNKVNIEASSIMMSDIETQTDKCDIMDQVECTLCGTLDESINHSNISDSNCDIFKLTKAIQINVKNHKHLINQSNCESLSQNVYITKKKKCYKDINKEQKQESEVQLVERNIEYNHESESKNKFISSSNVRNMNQGIQNQTDFIFQNISGEENSRNVSNCMRNEDHEWTKNKTKNFTNIVQNCESSIQYNSKSHEDYSKNRNEINDFSTKHICTDHKDTKTYNQKIRNRHAGIIDGEDNDMYNVETSKESGFQYLGIVTNDNYLKIKMEEDELDSVNITRNESFTDYQESHVMNSKMNDLNNNIIKDKNIKSKIVASKNDIRINDKRNQSIDAEFEIIDKNLLSTNFKSRSAKKRESSHNVLGEKKRKN